MTHDDYLLQVAPWSCMGLSSISLGKHSVPLACVEANWANEWQANCYYCCCIAVCVEHPDGLPSSLTVSERHIKNNIEHCAQGLDETPLTFVDTLDALHALAASLAGAHEIAVDLEAHAHRSFQARPLASCA